MKRIVKNSRLIPQLLFILLISIIIGSSCTKNTDKPTVQTETSQNKKQTETPQYKSPETKNVIEKMINAHGGMQKWNDAKTFSFEHIMTFDQEDSTHWWVSREITDKNTMRTYHEWPQYGTQLANNGNKTWTVNWKIQNPPGMHVNWMYSTLALPWLTQNKHVILSEPGTEKLVKDSITNYITVKMTFDSTSGESPYKYYKLFIDPVTYLLRGVEYTVTYGAFLDLIQLPKEVKFVGPSIHAFSGYSEAGGLLFPNNYNTYGADGVTYGRHTVVDYSLTKSFDESKMEMPNSAAIDSSSSKRKN